MAHGHHQFGWADHNQDFSVPDVIGEIVAWRCWKYNRLNGYLMSVHKGYTWSVLAPRNTAHCAVRTHMDPIPYSHCHCGFYALKTLDLHYLLANSYLIEAPVWGLVALSGRIIEGRAGYRAQYARPLRLWINPHRDEVVKKQGIISFLYNVPVSIFEWEHGSEWYDHNSTTSSSIWPLLPGAEAEYERLVRELQGGGEIVGDRRGDEGVHDRADPGGIA